MRPDRPKSPLAYLAAFALAATAAAPAPQTTLAGWTFGWSQGVVLDHTFATGESLVTKYQKVYGLGVLLGNGTLVSDGVLLGDVYTQGARALVHGDNTASMPVMKDTATTTTKR